MLVKSKIKYIQSLGQKKFRDAEAVFIAEGPKLVHELIHTAPQMIKEVYALPQWKENNNGRNGAMNITEITGEELERISQLQTPNQVLAVIHQFPAVKTILAKDAITLALDTIQDPGNMGTIIRIADWFGVKQIVCSTDSVDIYNPKVVQATMGSIARVKILYTDILDWIREQNGVRLYATALEGSNIMGMEKINEGIIVIGNESRGIQPGILDLAAVKITIPRTGMAESLNAAVATGIILSHLV
jgi:RNA methyltransferase, TrmH family